MDVPADLQPSDPLGRHVTSRKDAAKARRRIRPHHFVPKLNSDRLSVDRLDHQPNETMANIAARVTRASGKPFCGWIVVSVEAARHMNRRVEVTPLLDNPYHADIVLPVPYSIDPDERNIVRRHALNLALSAEFRPTPTGEEWGPV
jgi:hypothetical protein